MHGVVGKPPGAAVDAVATSKIMLLMLVAMTGVAPISLYMLVPALPRLATAFGRDISIAQMTVSLYMVGIALSQIVMGPLSDRFGRRPVLLAGLGLMTGNSYDLGVRVDDGNGHLVTSQSTTLAVGKANAAIVVDGYSIIYDGHSHVASGTPGRTS